MRLDSRLREQQLLDVLETGRCSILTVLAEAEDALGSPACSRAKTLASVQWRLMREIRAYQLTRHAELFDRACRGKSESQIRLAADMKDRCIQLGDTYNQHFKEWSGRSDGANWPRFEAETRALFRKVKDQLAREAIEARKLI